MRMLDRRGLLRAGLALSALPTLALAQGVNGGGQAIRPAGVRRALLLGNASYVHTRKLVNPANDVKALAGALKSMAFEVTPVIDGGFDAMKSALSGFRRSIQTDDVALVYYAGHGLQYANSDAGPENFLIPLDAELASAERLSSECLALSEVFEELRRSSAKVSVIVLDACRENGFAKTWDNDTRGLAPPAGWAPPQQVARSAVVAYATKPGGLAEDRPGEANGLYTSELLEQIRRPGLTVATLLAEVSGGVERRSKGRQEPWTLAAGSGGLYVLNPEVAAPANRSAGADNAQLAAAMRAAACKTQSCFDSEIAAVRDPSLLALARQARGQVEGSGSDGGASGAPYRSIGPAVARRQRAAFLLGVGRYQHPAISQLVGGPNDAGYLAIQLDRQGFDVTLSLNSDRAQYDADVESFFRTLQPDAEVLFYFSGMGGLVATADPNLYKSFMVLVDGAPSIESPGIVLLDPFLERLQAKRPHSRLMILDTCSFEISEKFPDGRPVSAPRAGLEVSAKDCGFAPSRTPKGGPIFQASAAASGALFCYAAELGTAAYDTMPGTRNGAFALELLPRLPASRPTRDLMLEVSEAVRILTGDLQVPYVTSTGATVDLDLT
jgi:uncharacterized caspase-like protein